MNSTDSRDSRDSRKIKILIIGENFTQIKNSIKIADAKFYHKHTSLEAQKVIRNEKPDVVVLNIGTALKRGTGQVGTLLKSFPGLLIIGISDISTERIYTDFIASGAEDCMSFKNIEMLTKVITHSIARRRNIVHERCKNDIENFKLITEYTNDVIWIMDGNLKFLYLSPSIKKLRGFTPEEVMKQRFDELFIPESLEKVSGVIKDFKSKLQANEKSKEPFRIEVWQPCKNEDVVPVEVIVNPIYDEDDEFKYFLGIARGIIERKQNEQKLLESQERYRFIVENQNDLILKLDPEFRILFASMQYCKTFNKTEEELIGESFMPLIHPDDRESAFKAMSKLFKPPYKTIHTERALTNSGWTWFEWSDKAIVDKKGLIKEIISVGRDINQQKIADDAVKESEEKYRRVVENIQDIYFESKIDGTITEVSPSLSEMSKGQYTRDEVIGKSLYDFYYEPKEAVKLYRKLMRTGKVEDFEIVLKNRDGSSFTSSFSAKLLTDEQGNVQKVIGLIRDITLRKNVEKALKESEEKYRGLFNSINNGILLTDVDRKIVDCNPAFSLMFGYELDDIKGENTKYLYNDITHFNETGVKILELLDTGKPFTKIIEFKKKNGTMFKGETSIFYLKDESGETSGLIGLIRDITQTIAIENELQEQQEKLNNIIKHSNELFYLHDTEHNLLYASPQSDEMFGYLPKEMKIKWTSLITDNPINQIGYEKTMKAIQTGMRQEPYLLELEKKDKSIIIVEVDESPIKDENDNVIAISGALRNVTEKYHKEMELKSLASFVELNPYPIISYNPDGIVTYANTAASSIFGVSVSKDVKLTVLFPEQNIQEIISTIKRESTLTFYVKSENRTYLMIAKGIPDSKSGYIYGADISSLNKIHEDLGKNRNQLQSYAAYLQSVREEERLSFARELHDDFAQTLSALKMFTTTISKKIETQETINTISIKNDFVNMNHMLDKAILSVRNVLKKLRPEVLEDFGLLEAIKIMIDEFITSSGIPCKIECSVREIKLEQQEQLALYRICQEALTNIARHSAATNSTFQIKTENNKYIIVINDNGQGFERDILFKKESFGIIGMRERAAATGGELIINSNRGEGTQLKIIVPF